MAGLLITTEAMIGDKPKKDTPAPQCRAVAAWAAWTSKSVSLQWNRERKGRPKGRPFCQAPAWPLPQESGLKGAGIAGRGALFSGPPAEETGFD